MQCRQKSGRNDQGGRVGREAVEEGKGGKRTADSLCRTESRRAHQYLALVKVRGVEGKRDAPARTAAPSSSAPSPAGRARRGAPPSARAAPSAPSRASAQRSTIVPGRTAACPTAWSPRASAAPSTCRRAASLEGPSSAAAGEVERQRTSCTCQIVREGRTHHLGDGEVALLQPPVPPDHGLGEELAVRRRRRPRVLELFLLCVPPLTERGPVVDDVAAAAVLAPRVEQVLEDEAQAEARREEEPVERNRVGRDRAGLDGGHGGARGG